MTATCRVCGHQVVVESWSKEYERLKLSNDPAYVCDACEQKIRSDAQHNQTH